jgi:hypothetical protein
LHDGGQVVLQHHDGNHQVMSDRVWPDGLTSFVKVKYEYSIRDVIPQTLPNISHAKDASEGFVLCITLIGPDPV